MAGSEGSPGECGVRQALVGADIVRGDSRVKGHAVLVDGDRIAGVVRVGAIPTDYRVRDVGPGMLCPGFVDIHTHGAGGAGFNEGNPAAHRRALDWYRRAGVTTVLPTLSSGPLEQMLSGIEAYEAVRHDFGGPRIPGVHLEGPYFAPTQCGAQDRSALRRPDDGSVDVLLEHADAIRMMSFAPELPGAVALTERLVDRGIVAAAGHSDCRDTDLSACQRAGLSHVIHIVSGQSTTVRESPWRRPGLLEATLASDELTVEMIADGKHLPPTLMRMAVRSLQGRLCVVSDSTAGAGLAEGEYYTLGEQTYVVESGVGMTLDRTAFAGSTTLVPQMLRVLRDQVGVPLLAAVAMVTEIPARAAHLTDQGRIEPGYFADLVVLDDALTVRSVAIGGVWQ